MLIDNPQERTSKATESFQEALNETIEAFKSLIANPVEELKNWKHYGNAKSCRLCTVSVVPNQHHWRCSVCPLSGCAKIEPARTRLALCGALESQRVLYIETTARTHLKWIIKTAVNNGYKVKEETLANYVHSSQHNLNLRYNSGGDSHNR